MDRVAAPWLKAGPVRRSRHRPAGADNTRHGAGLGGLDAANPKSFRAALRVCGEQQRRPSTTGARTFSHSSTGPTAACSPSCCLLTPLARPVSVGACSFPQMALQPPTRAGTAHGAPHRTVAVQPQHLPSGRTVALSHSGESVGGRGSRMRCMGRCGELGGWQEVNNEDGERGCAAGCLFFLAPR